MFCSILKEQNFNLYTVGSISKLFVLSPNSGPVLSLAISSNGEQCFSGGIDATIQWWNMPSPNVDPYDTYGKYLLKGKQLITIVLNINFLPDNNLFSKAFVKCECHLLTKFCFSAFFLCVVNA